MAASTIILQMHLDMAGITDTAITAALLGQTVAVAADLYLVGFQLAMANAATQRAGIVRYILGAQETIFDPTQVAAVIRMLRQMKSAGAGGLSIPVSFS